MENTAIKMKKAWTYGEMCETGAFSTKAGAIKHRNRVFAGLYTKKEFDELLPVYRILAPVNEKGMIMNSRYDLFENI